MNAVAAVIPSWNTRELLARCLAALERSSAPVTVVVVDNASSDGSPELVLRDFPRARLLRNPENRGFAAACNQGIAATSEPFVLLLNSDAEMEEGALAVLAEFLEAQAEYAAAAPRLVHADGSTQRACMAFPSWATPLWFATPLERWFPRSAELERYFARDFDYEHDGDALQPPAAALLLRRSALEAVGLLDERLWLYFNDVDLSRRLAAAGWRTRYLSSARVLHVGGASTRRFPSLLERWHLDRLRYYRKHHGPLAGAWVKLCTAWAFADFAVGSLGRKLARRGPRGEPLGPTARAFARFLAA